MTKVLLSLYKVIWKEEIFKENSSTTQAFKGFLSLFEKINVFLFTETTVLQTVYVNQF